MKYKLVLNLIMVLVLTQVVSAGIFSPTPPPPMVGPEGPEGPMGPPGPPGNYTIGMGLELINNGTEIQVNLSFLGDLYNDTALIFSVNSSLWQELNTKLDITDQRYNDTALIQQVNSSLLGEISSSFNTLQLQINNLYSQLTNLSNDVYLINSTLNERIDNITDDFVLKAGDTMTGNLNMSDNNITDVHTLFVHNISGRSPIYVSSELISGSSITADTFYGNIQGANGTIFGVQINNGTINSLIVADSAFFDTEVTFNGSLIPVINNTYSLGTDEYMWKSFYVNELVALNLSTPEIQELYNLINILNSSIKTPTGPYLAYDNNSFWINETKLNETINDISKVRMETYTMTCTPVSGTCNVTSSIDIDYQIVRIKVTATTSTNKFRFEMTEHPDTTEIIDRNLIRHEGVWDINKNYAINGKIQANIIDAQIDELFTIETIYLNNEVSY